MFLYRIMCLEYIGVYYNVSNYIGNISIKIIFWGGISFSREFNTLSTFITQSCLKKIVNYSFL